MNNKRSSYYKLFRKTMFAVFSLLVLLGAMVIFVSTVLYRSYRFDEIRETGDLFTECLKNSYSHSGNIKDTGIIELHKNFTSKDNSIFVVYDEYGNAILSESDYSETSISFSDFQTISESMRERLDKKDFLDFDTSNISKDEPYILYASQFFIKQENEELPKLVYIAVYDCASDINAFTVKMVLLYTALAILGVSLLYFILRHAFRRQAAYEYDFMRISEMYARGDFTETIPTDVSGINKEIAYYVNTVASNVAKSEETSKTFIANVSHELRTPMTTIGGFVDGILDGTIPKSRQNEYLVLVSNEIKRLKILISSMLNMSRFETGTLKPNFKETNLTDLVIKTVLMFEKKIDDKHLEVEGLGSPRVDAVVDADLIQQVIYNLVENAVKFINDRGTLTFNFEKVNGEVHIAIKNTGEGLKDTEIQQVFDRFYKTDSSRGKDTTGLGLGLAISRKIVHLHNGHIAVKSVYGEYTEFEIQIPDNLEEQKG